MASFAVANLQMDLEEVIAFVIEYEEETGERISFFVADGQKFMEVPTVTDAVYAKLKFG